MRCLRHGTFELCFDVEEGEPDVLSAFHPSHDPSELVVDRPEPSASSSTAPARPPTAAAGPSVLRGGIGSGNESNQGAATRMRALSAMLGKRCRCHAVFLRKPTIRRRCLMPECPLSRCPTPLGNGAREGPILPIRCGEGRPGTAHQTPTKPRTQGTLRGNRDGPASPRSLIVRPRARRRLPPMISARRLAARTGLAPAARHGAGSR